MQRRRVKCVDTGEYSYNIDCFKGDDGKWYTTEEAYKRISSTKICLSEEESNFRRKYVNIIWTALGYKTEQRPPTIIFRKLKEFEGYGHDVIYQTVLEQQQNIINSIANKKFETEFHRISYVMAIIGNNILDVYKRKVAKEKAAKFERDYEVPTEIDIEDIGGAKSKDVKSKNMFEDDLWN